MDKNDLYSINNEAGIDLERYQYLLDSLLPYIAKHLKFDKPVTINFISDKKNASKDLGKTGYYHPDENAVYVFTDGRHIKDILRSLAHELVHHMQNCRGDFSEHHAEGQGYALRDKFLWNRELEAYLEGNKLFRRWEDLYKENHHIKERKEKLYNTLLKEVTKGRKYAD
jgi:hypothetical protein